MIVGEAACNALVSILAKLMLQREIIMADCLGTTVVAMAMVAVPGTLNRIWLHGAAGMSADDWFTLGTTFILLAFKTVTLEKGNTRLKDYFGLKSKI